MEEKKISLELTSEEYMDLVKLVTLGYLVTEEIVEEKEAAGFTELQQKVLAASRRDKDNLHIAYDKKEDEYFMSDELEASLLDLLEEYDESRFWEGLIMRLTMRDLQKKFSEKELAEMPPERGTKELEIIHNYYISEFDDNDLDNLKIVSMRRV